MFIAGCLKSCNQVSSLCCSFSFTLSWSWNGYPINISYKEMMMLLTFLLETKDWVVGGNGISKWKDFEPHYMAVIWGVLCSASVLITFSKDKYSFRALWCKILTWICQSGENRAYMDYYHRKSNCTFVLELYCSPRCLLWTMLNLIIS